MLKRLELIGFKSFAEKTQFDFGPGITAIVGPNGSGKSNLVDAVRWILGEQSAKSLRGGEMADVIFNGSSSRRSLGLAEVTLTLDNTRRTLALDADEIQFTRRVHRDGEGEYLINKQPARLKDFKEIFLGSGASTEAYSTIEQGRVDVLLQASTRDRRAIFEEAAGISRFKTKKLETFRKLENVEQNLLRLRDIIEEVERQLRSVKLQASKAHRYREYTERLKDLRIALSLEEYHHLSGQLTQVQATLEQVRNSLVEQQQRSRLGDAGIQDLEGRIAELDSVLRQQGSHLAASQQQIATEATRLQHERTSSADLEEDLRQTRSQLQGHDRQMAESAEAVERACRELAEVEAARVRQREAAQRLEAEQEQLQARLAELGSRIQADKGELLERMRQAADFHNEQVSLKAQITSLTQHGDRIRQKNSQTTQTLSHLDTQLRELTEMEQRIQGELASARQQQAELRRQQEELGQTAEETGRELSSLREQRSGLVSRVQILEDLERSHEGLSPGVREVLALPAQPEPGPWQTVVGLVADLLTASHEYAALVDLALGERAHAFLVRDPEVLAKALSQHDQPFSGRVAFLPLANAGKPCLVRELPNHPGLIASAADWVSCSDPLLAGLPEQLLGATLVVRDLASAREIAALATGYRFLTLQGELLETDGTLTIGRHHAEAGLVSRKSELRELREQVVGMDARIVELEQNLSACRANLTRTNMEAERAEQGIQALAEQLADSRSRLTQQRERQQDVAQELQLNNQETRQIETELLTLQKAYATAESAAQDAERQVQELRDRLAETETSLRDLEARRQQGQQQCTAAQVALATAEERHGAVAHRHAQHQEYYREHQAEKRRLEEHLAAVQQRLLQSQLSMLRATSTLAEAHLAKEAAEAGVSSHQHELESLRSERQRQVEQAQLVRQQTQNLQEQFHQHELEASDLHHRLDHLTARLREEHEVDLVGLYLGYQPPTQPVNPQAAEEEAAELKRKITRLGNVSLDAIQELEELEQRAKTLQVQHDDLATAKRSLEDIISKINQDSRRLFLETFQTICGHFQELFRKLFGGGMADIILENEEDILESGIEIVARPPGKDLRSISLMSGGEKTLTAVALLLAIFRSKPSPFCILDEVDAALDEANIGRFTAVLHEFLDQSQFIIVTHSKKTMAAADVLYGVTMQESGVSKQVAVRFEDWPDEAASPMRLDQEQAESAA